MTRCRACMRSSSMAALQWRTRDDTRLSIGSEGDTGLNVKQQKITSPPSPPHKIQSTSSEKPQRTSLPPAPNGHQGSGEQTQHILEPLAPNGHLVCGDSSRLTQETAPSDEQLVSRDSSNHSLEPCVLTNGQQICLDDPETLTLSKLKISQDNSNSVTVPLTNGQESCRDNSENIGTVQTSNGQASSEDEAQHTLVPQDVNDKQPVVAGDVTQRRNSTPVVLTNRHYVSGDFVSAKNSDRSYTSPLQNGDNLTYDDNSQTVVFRNKAIERTGGSRHSFRCSVKRRSLRLLKNLKVRPSHLRMSMSLHTRQRNSTNMAVYPVVSTCLLDTDDIDKGEVVFFSYSENGTAYTEETVPICNAGCQKHKIRWSDETEVDEKKSHHGDDYDSGGEFGDCDDHQVDEVLADYSLKEAPIHVTSTLGRLPPNHSFESMSTDDFNSSFAYCETEHLNTIRRSTVVKRDKSTSSTSLNSTNSRKSRFIANVNKKMSSSKAAWPLRSLWLFLTRQKDDSHRKRRDFGETMESATRYIRIASHYEDAYIGVSLTLQTVAGAGQQLRDVQIDLISTALKAFFTVDEGIDIAWVNDVPRVIQRHLAVGDARVHFAVPDIRQCVACLLLSPDAAILLRRRECILLSSIAEVLECQEECLVVMQTRPGMESTLSRASPSSSSNRPMSSPPSPGAVSSLEWMAHIPTFSS